jgi:hypothetical protein
MGPRLVRSHPVPARLDDVRRGTRSRRSLPRRQAGLPRKSPAESRHRVRNLGTARGLPAPHAESSHGAPAFRASRQVSARRASVFRAFSALPALCRPFRHRASFVRYQKRAPAWRP